MKYFIAIYIMSGIINYWFFYKSFFAQFFDLLFADHMDHAGLGEVDLNSIKRAVIVLPLINTFISLQIIKITT